MAHVGAGQDVGVDVGGGPARVGVGVAGEGPPPRVEHELVGDGASDPAQDRAHPEHPVLLESAMRRNRSHQSCSTGLVREIQLISTKLS